LERAGVVIPSAAAADMQAALVQAEAGAARLQCTSTVCVFLLYYNRVPSVEEAERYERDVAALGGDPKGTVDIRQYDTYIKMSSKSSVIILERALKSPALFLDFKTSKATQFASHGLQHCVIQWTRILANAESTAPDDVPMQLAYLRGYFFSEHLGRGMPDDCSLRTSVAILGTAASRGATAARNAHLRPTVPTAFDLALSAGVMGEDSLGSLSLGGQSAGSSSSHGSLPLYALTGGSYAGSSAGGSTVPSSAGGGVAV